MSVDPQPANQEPASPPAAVPAASVADRILHETVLGFAQRLAKLSQDLRALRGELERDADTE